MSTSGAAQGCEGGGAIQRPPIVEKILEIPGISIDKMTAEGLSLKVKKAALKALKAQFNIGEVGPEEQTKKAKKKNFTLLTFTNTQLTALRKNPPSSAQKGALPRATYLNSFLGLGDLNPEEEAASAALISGKLINFIYSDHLDYFSKLEETNAGKMILEIGAGDMRLLSLLKKHLGNEGLPRNEGLPNRFICTEAMATATLDSPFLQRHPGIPYIPGFPIEQLHRLCEIEGYSEPCPLVIGLNVLDLFPQTELLVQLEHIWNYLPENGFLFHITEYALSPGIIKQLIIDDARGDIPFPIKNNIYYLNNSEENRTLINLFLRKQSPDIAQVGSFDVGRYKETLTQKIVGKLSSIFNLDRILINPKLKKQLDSPETRYTLIPDFFGELIKRITNTEGKVIVGEGKSFKVLENGPCPTTIEGGTQTNFIGTRVKLPGKPTMENKPTMAKGFQVFQKDT